MQTFASAPPTEGKPIPFEIGVYRKTPKPTPESEGDQPVPAEPVKPETEWVKELHTFHITPDVSGTIVIGVDLSTERGQKVEAMLDLYDAALHPDDREAWNALTGDPDVFIDRTTINQIGQWMYRLYTGFPTQQS